MKRLLSFVGMTVGGWLGWKLGILISLFLAYVTAVVGTALGLYGAHRFAKRILP